MRVKIDDDEWYPVYFITEMGIEIEADEAMVERWKRVAKEFDEVQREMKALMNEATRR